MMEEGGGGYCCKNNYFIKNGLFESDHFRWVPFNRESDSVTIINGHFFCFEMISQFIYYWMKSGLTVIVWKKEKRGGKSKRNMC